MATNITMPQMGFDMTEGTIANWLKSEGEPVQKGDPIAEIETDKTTIQIEAFAPHRPRALNPSKDPLQSPSPLPRLRRLPRQAQRLPTQRPSPAAWPRRWGSTLAVSPGVVAMARSPRAMWTRIWRA
jgi:hypothetical protein